MQQSPSIISNVPEQEDNKKKIEQIVQLIDSCPSWIDIPQGVLDAEKSETLNAIQNHLILISGYETQDIREAISSYYQNTISSNKFDVRAKSRLFLINRYLFNVPNLSQQDVPDYVGWKIKTTEEVDVLWPLLAVDKEGKITLDIKLAVYTGQPYLPIKEFDYFNSHFGRRKTRHSL